MSNLIGSKEFAARLGISLRTLDSLDKKGELPASLRIGHLRRWRVADVENWINTRLDSEPPATGAEHQKGNACFCASK